VDWQIIFSVLQLIAGGEGPPLSSFNVAAMSIWNALRPAPLRYAERLQVALPANAAHMGTTDGRVCRATSKNREKLTISNPASTGQLSSSLGFDLLFGLLRRGFLRQRHRGHVLVEACLDVLGIDIRMLLVSRQTAE
jgi:hypothetical protein